MLLNKVDKSQRGCHGDVAENYLWSVARPKIFWNQKTPKEEKVSFDKELSARTGL